MGLSLAVSLTGLAAVTGTAQAATGSPQLSVVVADGQYTGLGIGDLEWRGGRIYALTGGDRPTAVTSWPDDASHATVDEGTSVAVPPAWTSDGFWQSDRDAFSVTADGSIYVRAPYYNRGAGGAEPMAYGWGIGRLDPDGTMSPAAVPPGGSTYTNELAGNSESIALDPDGSGFIIGGARHKPGGYQYGVVAEIPLPVPDDQQAGAEMIASADSYDSNDSSTYHGAPFLTEDDVRASDQPFLGNVADVDAKGRYVYERDNIYTLNRIDRRTDTVVTICCGPWQGWDTPPPVEGDLAMETYLEMIAGPVADRDGNVFFVTGNSDRFYGGGPDEVWEIRGSDGRLHHVAGATTGGVAPADGVDPLAATLANVVDLVLDPQGDLYVSTSPSFYEDKQIIRLAGVAAADTAPDAPDELTATPSHGAIDVSWQAPLNDGGQSVTGYTVTVHPHGASGAAGDVVRQAAEPGTITVDGLADETTYDIGVTATNALGTGPAATTSAAPTAYAAVLAVDADHVSTGQVVHLDASGSHAPPGATFAFSCGQTYGVDRADSTTPTATCSYDRGSDSSGWHPVVRMTDPASGRVWTTTSAVVVDDAPGTVEGSTAFDTGAPLATVTVKDDGSLGSATCGGVASKIATCLTIGGSDVLLRALPHTFDPGTVVSVLAGDAASLQQEAGDRVQTSSGFAVTWTRQTAPRLPRAGLLVDIAPTPAAAGPASSVRSSPRVQVTRQAFDLGIFGTFASQLASGAGALLNTIGHGISSAANAVSQWWQSAQQSVHRPNGSDTNQVARCEGKLQDLRPLGGNLTCHGFLVVETGVPTITIASLGSASGVVAAGGANVVAAGGGNVVAAGGANVVAAGGLNLRSIGAGELFQLAGNAVVAAGGANVVAAGGLNNPSGLVSRDGAGFIATNGAEIAMAMHSDPGFVVASPHDATPPTVTATLDPAPPASGVYPHGTQVHVHLAATGAAGKTVQGLHYQLGGATPATVTTVEGDAADLVVDATGLTALAFTATDDQLVTADGSATVEIAPKPVPQAQTLTFAQPAAVSYGDGPVALSATASSGLPVTLTSMTPDVCSLVSGSLQVLHAGTCQVTASQGGDDLWLAADPVTRDVTVSRARLTVTATDAVRAKGRPLPLVAPVFSGWVGHDGPRVLTSWGSCVARKATGRTVCSGVKAADYRAAYAKGRLTRSTTGYALHTPAAATWAKGTPVAWKVTTVGATAPRLVLRGRLPQGVQASLTHHGTRLKLTGTPRRAGTRTVTVKAKKGTRTVAEQTLVLVVYR